MCSVLILRHAHPDYPLVLATNRDEFYARPASGPVRLLQSPRAVGGRDDLAGGSWMGVTAEGLFVGVTNQRTYYPADPALHSRGQLVIQALRHGEVDAIRQWVRGLDGRNYNGFNLLFGDAQQLWVAYGRSDRKQVEQVPVPAGAHVLPNDVLDSPEFFKATRGRHLLEPLARAPWPQLRDGLVAALADHMPAPLTALPSPPEDSMFDRELLRALTPLCVRTEHYGTRSSTLIALQPGRVAQFLWADGPPDATPFQDTLPLLHD